MAMGNNHKNVGEVLQMVSTAQLLKIMECPVCLELPIPPITNCVNGHIVCSFCRPTLKSCFLCNGRLTEAICFLAESIVDAAFMRCKYFEKGCKEVLVGSQYRNHVELCEYRPVQCYENREIVCNGGEVDFSDYIRHLKQDHEIEGYDEEHTGYEKTESIAVLESKMTFPLFYFTYNERIFLKNTRVENSKIHWWISLVGSQREAEMYGATVILYRKDFETMKVEFRVPVHSFRKTFEKISERTECASVSIGQLPPYCLMDSVFLNDDRKVEYLWDMKFLIWEM